VLSKRDETARSEFDHPRAQLVKLVSLVCGKRPDEKIEAFARWIDTGMAE
jgi:hypothetical protein